MNINSTRRDVFCRTAAVVFTCCALFAAINAECAAIQFTTVSSTYQYLGTETRSDLVQIIANEPLLCSESLSTAALFGGQTTDCGAVGNVDFGYYLNLNFQVSACDPGLWSFRLGPDFGRGGVIFVDGVKQIDTTMISPGDNWWNYDWNSPSVLYVNDLPLIAGAHRLEIFGFEGCCAGEMSLQFQNGAAEWQEVSIANLTPLDVDGDGVPDCDDACPESNLTATVVIEACDSGVPNVLLPSGCTLTDKILACSTEAANHGEFVSCVALLTRDLMQDGALTGAQKGAIERCAAKSSIGK